MKIPILLSGLLLLSLLAPLSVAQSEAGAAEYRTFKSQTGKELRARLIRVEGDKAILRRSNLSEIPVPIAALSIDDQTYIQNWDPAERARAAAKNAAGGMGLSNFMKEKGYASAKLTQKGKSILVEVKLNGKPYTFIFDSGRALSMVDSEVAAATNVEVYRDVDFGDFPAIDGGTEKVYAGATKTFEIAGLEIKGFELGVCSLKRIGIEASGIMGADVLQYYDGIADWDSMILFFLPEQ
ncbi:MAG: retropepsin-like aspartic protease [Verrucomicrobiota bacterium]